MEWLNQANRLNPLKILGGRLCPTGIFILLQTWLNVVGPYDDSFHQ
jgi:hypothetical protein